MDVWNGVSVFKAGTSGQKASRLKIEPTVVNDPADWKHHLDLLPTQRATLFSLQERTLP